MITLGVIAVGVSMMTQSALHSRRASRGVESRIDASLVATSVLNAIATTQTAGIHAMASSAHPPGNWIDKTKPTLAWLGNWESPGEVRNIRVRFSAFQVLVGPTPALTPVPYPNPLPSPSWTPEPSHQVDLELELSRDSGKTWQPFRASKWVAR